MKIPLKSSWLERHTAAGHFVFYQQKKNRTQPQKQNKKTFPVDEWIKENSIFDKLLFTAAPNYSVQIQMKSKFLFEKNIENIQINGNSIKIIFLTFFLKLSALPNF